ncbi:MAG: hypothetical protein COV36_01770 [Alphaproteobacteria bacterium CG11_big_fil_rev_8_21_14_0_20_44_7]|nr:MAG: hypothetical protein COV36_01770 [Alphaproteobacteria bacterium CG11_big_fil_rev_8_21_14_0_20_44_7]
MITKEEILSKIEIDIETGNISVMKKINVKENDEVISSNSWRVVVEKNDEAKLAEFLQESYANVIKAAIWNG